MASDEWRMTKRKYGTTGAKAGTSCGCAVWLTQRQCAPRNAVHSLFNKGVCDEIVEIRLARMACDDGVVGGVRVAACRQIAGRVF